MAAEQRDTTEQGRPGSGDEVAIDGIAVDGVAIDGIAAERIAAAMEELRAGVRRQRAATGALEAARQQLPPGGGGLSVIAELHEPVCTSALPVFGRLLVLARRVVLKLFLGWYIRPVLQQQSRFNQALAQHLGGLVDAQRALRRDLEALEEEVRQATALPPGDDE